MIKEKSCKGTGLAKGYGCGKMTAHYDRVYGLGKMCGCYPGWLLNSENGKIKLAKSVLKASKPRLDLEKAFNESKQNKSLGHLLINTRTACHEYIRERDKGKPCISCGQPWHNEFQAGHFYKAELFSRLKYNENNIHGQCPGCNLGKEGNLNDYAINIKERVPGEMLEKMEALASIDKKHPHSWDRSILIEIRNYYKKKLKELNV